MGFRVWRAASALSAAFLRRSAFTASSRSIFDYAYRSRSVFRSMDVFSSSKFFIQTVPLSLAFVNSNYGYYRSMVTETSKAENPPLERPNTESKREEDGKKEFQGSDFGLKHNRGSPVGWMSFALLIITGIGLIIYFDREKKRRIEEMKTKVAVATDGESVGKADIGGPLSLVNHEGKSVTQDDFKGKWTLIYFGFTHCPDICPDELQKMVAAIDKIKEKSALEVVPVFVTVDPDRDSVEQVREYVQEFHPNLIGLTGSPTDIKQVAKAFRVYYMKTEEEDSDYLVDHSIVMYLMDPDFEFLKFFGRNEDVDSLTNGIVKAIKSYKH